MTPPRLRRTLAPAIGWSLVVLLLAGFVWGMSRRATLDRSTEHRIRMLFVPSVEQGTLVERGDELARFVWEDTGITLASDVPTSYAAVIQALGSGQADIAWMPAFAYVIANARYGAEARLQVVRTVDRYAIVVTRSGPGEPAGLEALASRPIALPTDLAPRLGSMIRRRLDELAPGWTEVAVSDDAAAVAALLDRRQEIAAAVSSHVFSGPFDLVGDGRKELEYDRPGTMASTQVVFQTEEPAAEEATVYYGCLFSRPDSGVRRIEDFAGRSFAFTDETSTSGHIFPRLLLDRAGVSLGRVYYAGGHANSIQAVWDGKAVGGAAFYSPPSDQHTADGTLVGDARHIVTRRFPELERRRAFLDEVRIVALTDPIPNDVCVTRAGFSPALWARFEASLRRFIGEPAGQGALFDLLAGADVADTEDAAFDDFRAALSTAGMSADRLLADAEARLAKKPGGGS